MSFSGFKKQVNKANQYVSEKIGSAEPTKATEEFIQLERKTDIINDVVEDMVVKTKEVLHPNPALRAKLCVNKIKGGKKEKYPHPENDLGESMNKYGNLLGKDTILGQSLIQMGLTLKETTEIKYSLEDTIKRTFLEPLTHLQLKDIKDCMHHRKKLEGRRLDFDCKKRKKLKGVNVFDADIKTAEEKYNESLKLSTIAMKHLLDNESQQISQLIAFSEAFYEYHNQCANIYKSLTIRLKNKSQSHNKVPDINSIWSSAVDTTTSTIGQYNGVTGFIAMNGQLNRDMSGAKNLISTQTNRFSYTSKVNDIKSLRIENSTPSCRALYDFQPQTNDELALKEGDIIQLKDKIDDSWFEGTINGRSGLFPISYVEVLVPLRHR